MAINNYAKLKKYPGIWRVDGIGQVIDSNRIEVHFSGLKPDKLDTPYRGEAKNGEHLNLSFHVATIYRFIVGSIWENGQKIQDSSSYCTQTFNINVSEIQWLKLDESLHLNNGQTIESIIPGFFFSLKKNRIKLKNTLYAKIPTINNDRTPWLIIPASEIFRFYIGLSTRLISTAISGNFESLVNWKLSEHDKHAPTLYVKTQLSKSEKLVFLRALSSQNAYQSLFQPHNHLKTTMIHNNNQSQNSNKKALIIKSSFPFKGRTTLVVSGKAMNLAYNLENKQAKEWAFYGMQIHECRHMFNCENAQIKGELARKAIGASDGNNADDNSPDKNISIPSIEINTDEIGEGTADAKLKRIIEKSTENRFPASKSITLHYDRKEGSFVGSSVKIDGHIPTNSLTHEDGSYVKDGKGTRGYDTSSETVSEPNRDISEFLSVLSLLRKNTKDKAWKIITLKLDNQYLIHEEDFITFFPKIKNKRKTWHLIDIENQTTRQIVWVEIYLQKDGENKYIYVAEMELKDNEKKGHCTLIFHHQVKSNRVNEKDFKNILILTIEKNRWISDDYNYNNDEHKKIKQELSKSITFTRFTHPPKRKKKNSNEYIKNDHEYNEHWAQQLIDNLIQLI